MNTENSETGTHLIKRQEQYWLDLFSGEIPVLNLPTDYPRPSIQSFEGGRILFQLDHKTNKEIKDLARKTGTTLYMVLLAAFNILLARYSGQEEIITGTVTAGRVHTDLDGIVGMFVNTLPIRTSPSGAKTCRIFLSEVREQVLRALENQDYQFEELVDKVVARRDPSRNPLFDTLFVLQDPEFTAGSEGLTLTTREMTKTTAKFDLTLFALEEEEGISFELEYCTRLFARETVQRMAGHYLNLLREIIANPDQAISSLQMLSDEERHQLLYDFNDTAADYPKDKVVQELFEEQAARTPESTALVFEDQSLTYRELNQRANQLARLLRSRGVGRDTIVGIMAERSLEMVIGLLGVLKAGGAYQPLDPDYPAERIVYMLKDSGAAILLTQRRLQDRIEFPGETIDLDDPETFKGEDANLDNINQPGDLIYVIYTSGSTGMPKGALVIHQGVVNYIVWARKVYLQGRDLDFPLYSSFSFDLTITSIFTPLISGRCIVIYGEEDGEPLINRVVKENKVGFIKLTPAHLMSLTEMDNQNSSIVCLLVAGDELKTELARKACQSFGKDIEIYNTYGPTETVMNCMIYKFNPEKDICNSVPIGVPADNVKLYVLDRHSNPVPIGVHGEICISGAGLGRGYLNRPELTAEKFVANPFLPGERMYRTGDLARRLPDGNIEFQGRIDHQVKIRGFRVELGEIEACLLTHESVKEAVVTARDDQAGTKYLCAYIVAEAALSMPELKEHLSRRLPGYMIPSYFVALEHLPLTVNGKIDRRALPGPEKRMETGTPYAAPGNPAEERLALIWEQLLGVQRIGIDDNFFDLGGHSLKAIALVSEIRKEFNAEVPIRQVFATPTVRGLAELIARARESAYPAIEPATSRERYPLSSAQKRIYALYQMEPDSPVYNIPAVMELGDEIDRDTLEQAFRALIRRHESLRTSFVVIDGELAQKIHQEVDFHLGYREVDEDEVATASGEFFRPFDLGRAPLFRASILKTPTRRLLLFDVHHIIFDGTSRGILTRDLASLCSGADLPEPRLQYRDYALWQNSLSGTDLIRRQEQYWLDLFSGEIPVLNLPTDYPRPSVQSFEGDRLLFQMDQKTTGEIEDLARETGTTPYMVLLAAFIILLARYSGQEEIITGTVTAGRNHTDLDGIVGMFVNTLPIRTSPSGDKNCRSFLSEVREQVLRALENQDYQFEELVEKVVARRDPSRNPLFDTLFVLQDPEFTAGSEGLTLTTREITNTTAKFDLSLSALEQDDDLGFELEYCTRLFMKETIQRMAGHYLNLLREITADLDQAISSLRMLSDEERRQLLHDFNDTAADYPKDKVVHEMFEEQVARTPESIALVFEDQSLTYRELNRRANQLARLLRSRGVGRDTIVGIMVERSLEMVVGLLGIVKAGGAYLPLDPDYPQERISFMLKDSAATVLLTQRRLRDRIDFPGEIIDLDDPETFRGEDTNPDSINKPEDLLYVIYTSGSTGAPKGVMIEHRNIVNLISHEFTRTDLDFTGRVLQFTTICFDVCYQEMFSTLFAGGQLHIANNPLRQDLHRLLQYISDNELNVVFLPPALLALIASDEESLEKLPGSLKHIIVAGEQLVVTPVLKTYLEDRRVLLHNHYGPSETHVVTTFTLDSRDKMVELPPIGQPVINNRIYILNRKNSLLPIGVPGELVVSGDSVGRGYLNRPALTAEKFVANPFIPGERMYRTGDLARWLPDGNIEFLGRIDHQVKIRGFRVELGEIETCLLTNEYVKEAVVIARDDQAGARYLCAYIVAEVPLSTPELREYLSRSLPGYMIPSYFVALDHLPLTPNGKIDRRALPGPEKRMETGAPSKDPPRNALETALVEIWESVLGISPIGVNEDFFDLGGNSLRAVQIAAKASTYFDKRLPVATVFQALSVAKLAALLRQGASSPTLITSLSPDGSRTPFFGMHIPEKFRLYLDRDFSFYRFQYGSTFSSCIEGIAEEYLKEVYKIQPAGSYLLGGYSIGGVIAFEMAQQLMYRGQDVPLLFLLDPTWNLGTSKFGETWLGYWISFIDYNLKNNTLPGKNLAQKLITIAAYFKRLPKIVNTHLTANRNHNLSPDEVLDHAHEVYRALANRYRPKPYHGKTIIVYSNESITDSGLTRYMAGDFKEYRLDKDHEGVELKHLGLKEEAAISAWADILNRGLQEVTKEARKVSGQ